MINHKSIRWNYRYKSLTILFCFYISLPIFSQGKNPEPIVILHYNRADSMWAEQGKGSSSLGIEKLELKLGQRVEFDTDWKHEKKKSDGRKFYGSHMRKVRNASTEPNMYIDVYVNRAPVKLGMTTPMELIRLLNNQEKADKADIVKVGCSRR